MTKNLKIDKQTLYKWLFVFLLAFMLFIPVRSNSGILDEFFNIEDGDSSILDKIRSSDIGTGKSLLGPILESATDYISATLTEVGSNFVDKMVNSFSPSYQTFANIVSGNDYNTNPRDMVVGNEVSISSDGFFGIPVISEILHAAKLIGMTIATLYLMFNLVLFAFGRAESIKTSLPMLLVSYVISMLIIGNAEAIISEIVSVFANIWAQSVMSTSPGVTFTFDDLWKLILFVKSMCKVKALAAITFILALLIFWKMFKAFIRLYISIIEHYLVMMLLLLFCPIIIPMVMTPVTSNMFKSYFRMIISQFICMCITVIMMKIFVATLMNGGWTATIVNYIAGLAFLKVAQNVDTYMSKMGLDIVAGAGNFAGASRGGLMGLMQLVRTVGMIRNGIGEYGQSLKDQGVIHNDPDVYERGDRIQKAVGRSSPNADSFTEAFAKAHKTAENYQTYVSNDQASAFQQATMSQHGMPRTLMDNFHNQMNMRSYSDGSTAASRVHSIKQWGNSFDFLDEKGRCIATGNVNDNGLLHWNNADTTKYSEVDAFDGATFIGSDGKGANDSEIYSAYELKSYLSDRTGDVKGFEGLQPNDVEGSTLYGEQWARVTYDNGTYRDVKVGYRGSGTWSDVPKGYTVDNVRNSKGQEVRVMYSDIKHRKPDRQEITPNPDTQTKKSGGSRWNGNNGGNNGGGDFKRPKHSPTPKPKDNHNAI